jgi:MFS family permease
MPFLSLYLTRVRHLSVETTGVVIALWGAGSMAAGIAGGSLADRVGRRSTMLLAFTAGPAFMIALGLARAPAAIGACTLLLSFFQDLYRPAMSAMLADVVPLEDRKRAFGLMYWAVNVGFSVAPVLAGLLSKLSFFALFVGDAATTLIYTAIIFVAIPETLPDRSPHERQAGFEVVARDRDYLAFIGASLLLHVVFGQVNVTLPVDMHAHGISDRGYGMLVAINGVLIVLLQPLVGEHLGRVRGSRVMAVASLLVGIGFGMNALGGTVALYAMGISIWTLGEIGGAPVASAVIAELAPKHLRGRYQGAFTLSVGTAAFLAPLVGSFVLARAGSRGLWLGCLAACMLCAALHLAIAPSRSRRVGRPD